MIVCGFDFIEQLSPGRGGASKCYILYQQVPFIYQFFAWIAWIKRQGREVRTYELAVAY